MTVAWANLVVRKGLPKVEGPGTTAMYLLLLLIQGAHQDCLSLRRLLPHCLQTRWLAGRQGCNMCGAAKFLRVKSSPK